MAPHGNQETFDAFVAARFAALARTAYLLTSNRHDAEDLVQTALAKAVPVWRRVEHRPEPYVRQIMCHENISHWRRRKPAEITTESPPETAAPDIDVPAEVTLQRSLAKLTPAQRTVLVLRYYEDLTEVQTAAAMGVAVDPASLQAAAWPCVGRVL